MQTQLTEEYLNSKTGQKADSILRKCVHCGFCNATCPTYQILGDELDGPRGRIYQIKDYLEGKGNINSLQLHLDRCLTCRSCETTCPSGVEYHKLLDIGRDIVHQHGKRPLLERIKRSILLGILPNRQRFGQLIRLAQVFRPLMPPSLKRKIPARSKQQSVATKNHHRFVLLLEGCVQPALAPTIHTATRNVLNKIGITVVTPPQAGCCGALPFHLGETEKARQMCRNNIDAWWPWIEKGAEFILVNTSGCGPMLKDYIDILADDPEYSAKARKVSELCRDISELLSCEDLSGLTGKRTTAIAFHSPCSLQHAQGINNLVEPILANAGFNLTTVTDTHLCCGSAGTYSLFQPEIANQLRKNKLETLEKNQADVIATANIGCLMHLAEKSTLPVRHWIELLDEG
ncbi:MAG: glycolate oxidase subunit GlcF [Gammaproteobacteria bacterium]